MASEIIKQIWCDLDLKKRHKRKEGQEAFATVLVEGKQFSIDLCHDCQAGLLYSDVVKYGYESQPLDNKPPRKSARRSTARKKSPRGGTRQYVECSHCGKVLTLGAGWSLHNKMHIEKDQIPDARPLPANQ